MTPLAKAGAVGFTPDTTDEELCEMFAANRMESVYEELDRRLRKFLFDRLLREHCYGDAAAAEDAVQQALLKLWESPDKFDARVTKLKVWVLTIAIRRAINAHKRWAEGSKAIPLSSMSGNHDTPYEPEDERAISSDENAVRNEQLEQLRAAVELLPDREREVIMARDFEGLGYEATAAKLNIPVGSIQTFERRAKKLLRIRLLRPHP